MVMTKLGEHVFEVDVVVKRRPNLSMRFTGSFHATDFNYIGYQKNGIFHREDGPAEYELIDDELIEIFYLDGIQLSRKEFTIRTSKMWKALYGEG